MPCIRSGISLCSIPAGDGHVGWLKEKEAMNKHVAESFESGFLSQPLVPTQG